MRSIRGTAAHLAIVMAALLAVGLVSGTLIRHLVQIIVPALSLAAALTRPWGRYAALPIFGFWLFIMALIWLYLLGFSDFAAGTYTPAEVALTLVIGAACARGVWRVLQGGATTSRTAMTLAILGFGALQLLALMISFDSLVAGR